MTNFKFGFIIFAATLMSAPSFAEAQSFTQRGTRQGAVAGAIVGAIIGDQNNEGLAGAAIGGLVGAGVGRAVGLSKDSRYGFGGGYSQPAYRGYGNAKPRSSYGYSNSAYRGVNSRGGGYGKAYSPRGGYGRGGGCPYARR